MPRWVEERSARERGRAVMPAAAPRFPWERRESRERGRRAAHLADFTEEATRRGPDTPKIAAHGCKQRAALGIRDTESFIVKDSGTRVHRVRPNGSGTAGPWHAHFVAEANTRALLPLLLSDCRLGRDLDEHLGQNGRRRIEGKLLWMTLESEWPLVHSAVDRHSPRSTRLSARRQEDGGENSHAKCAQGQPKKGAGARKLKLVIRVYAEHVPDITGQARYWLDRKEMRGTLERHQTHKLRRKTPERTRASG